MWTSLAGMAPDSRHQASANRPQLPSIPELLQVTPVWVRHPQGHPFELGDTCRCTTPCKCGGAELFCPQEVSTGLQAQHISLRAAWWLWTRSRCLAEHRYALSLGEFWGVLIGVWEHTAPEETPPRGPCHLTRQHLRPASGMPSGPLERHLSGGRTECVSQAYFHHGPH